MLELGPERRIPLPNSLSSLVSMPRYCSQTLARSVCCLQPNSVDARNSYLLAFWYGVFPIMYGLLLARGGCFWVFIPHIRLILPRLGRLSFSDLYKLDYFRRYTADNAHSTNDFTFGLVDLESCSQSFCH
jgi:hypothetical protein